MAKMVITCAVTGAETTKQQNPNLPVTPVEIADAAFGAYEAGAAILHLHVRDEKGAPTQDLQIFKDVISRVRAKCDIIIEVTTGGAVGMSAEERLQPISLEPEMASLDCGTVNFGDEYIVNSLPIMREFAAEMNRHKVRPTLECFDLSHVMSARKLISEGLVQPPFHFGFVMNVPGAINYDVHALSALLREIPEDAYWTAMGIGRMSIPALCGALAFGGNVRVGFEDSVYFSKGVLAQNNAQMVERARRMAEMAGYEIACPSEVRKMFGLRKS